MTYKITYYENKKKVEIEATKCEKEQLKEHHNKVIFKRMRVSKEYFFSDNIKEIQKFLKYNHSLYEVILENYKTKFVIDIDNKEKNNLFSYNDLIKFINDIYDFISIHYPTYNIQKKYTIHISYDGIFNNDPNKKQFYSAHIIFNDIILLNNKCGKKLLLDFLNYYYETNGIIHYFKQNDYIDFSFYSKSRLCRTLNQSKTTINIQDNKPIYEKSKSILKNVMIDPLLNTLTIQKNITENDLITYNLNEKKVIEIKDIEINENENETNYRNEIYEKLNFTIPKNLNIISNQINKTEKTYFTNKKIWKQMVYNILFALYTNNIKNINEILNHYTIKVFLEKSKVDNYDNIESYKNNIKYITRIYESKSFLNPNYLYSEIIKIPTYEELQFINRLYKSADKDQMQFLEVNKQKYFIFNNTYCYNLNYKELLENYKIIYRETKNKKQSKIIDKIICKKCYNFNLSLLPIENKEHNDFLNKNNVINVKDLNEIPIKSNKSIYVKAPVGTGKTHIIVRKILNTLLKNETNKILIISDIITLSQKQKSDITEILTDLGYNKNILHHYQDKEELLTEKKIVITSYDSYKKIYYYYKPSHIIIDEYKNVSKRFITIQDTTLSNQDKSNLLNILIKVIEKTKAVYLLDADLNNEIYNFIKTYIKKSIDFYKLTDHVKPHKVFIYKEKNGLDLLHTDLIQNKKIVIATTSRKMGETIFNKYHSIKKILFIDKNGAYINDKTEMDMKHSKKIKLKHIQDTTNWESFDIVIYTPTITTGISFNNFNFFDKCYVYLTHKATDPTQTAQFIFRVRETITNEIILFSKNSYFTINKIDFENRTLNDTIFYNTIKNNETIDKHKAFMEIENKKKEQITPFMFLLNFENIKKQEQEYIYLYKLLSIIYDWGVRYFESKIHYEKINNIEQEDEETNKINFETISLLEIIGEDFKNAKYLTDEELERYNKNGIEEDTQEYRDFQKTIMLKKYGVSKWFYETYKEKFNIDLINEHENLFYSLKNIQYLHFDKAFNIIIKNLDINEDYITKLLKSKNTNLKTTYKKVFNNYILSNVLKIMNIDLKNDMKKILYNGVSIDRKKNTELIDTIFKFMSENQNIVNYLNKLNRNRANQTTIFKSVKSFLTGVFSYYGLKINCGKENIKKASKTERNIFITIQKPSDSVLNFRYQLNINNTEDDKEYYNNLKNVFYISNSKIKLPNKNICDNINQMSNILNNGLIQNQVKKQIENKYNELYNQNVKIEDINYIEEVDKYEC